MHLSVPAPHVPAMHLPLLRLTGRLPVATLLLTVVHATAVVVALTAPGANALAGCVVLAGVTARWALHRRRSTARTVATATAAVDAVLPGEGVIGTAPAPAAAS